MQSIMQPSEAFSTCCKVTTQKGESKIEDLNLYSKSYESSLSLSPVAS